MKVLDQKNIDCVGSEFSENRGQTMNIIRKLLFLTIALFLLSASAEDFAPIPPFTSFVMDTIGMLDTTQRTSLESLLKAYETRTGSQIAVLLSGSTAPEAIEQYSIRVADAWKLGRKGIDDGVILIVAKNNSKALRRLRIETGRGVQGTLTDAQSKRILQDVIAPHFRSDDYYGGIMAGILRIMNLLDQEHLPAPNGVPVGHAADADDSLGIFGWAIAAVLVLIGVGILALVLFIGLKLVQSFLFIKHKFVKPKPNPLPKKNSKQGRSKDSEYQSTYDFSSSGSSSSSDSSSSGGGGSFDGGGASGDW